MDLLRCLVDPTVIYVNMRMFVCYLNALSGREASCEHAAFVSRELYMFQRDGFAHMLSKSL